MSYKKLKERINKAQGQKEQLELDKTNYQSIIKKTKKHLVNLEEALTIVDLVGLETQQQIKYHVSDITSLALESIFPDPYKVVIDFVKRRGKIECDIFFERDGHKLDPLDSSGYGAANIASFALRIASWSMQRPRTRNTIILDEPFHFLSPEYHESAGMMVKELSRRLNLQFIIITHKPKLADMADNTIRTRLVKGKTKITRQ